MWKRYEAPAKEHGRRDRRNDPSPEIEGPLTALGDATNTHRPVKRLRLKDGPANGWEGKENKPAQYLATLHDEEAQGTPKRAYCMRQIMCMRTTN